MDKKHIILKFEDTWILKRIFYVINVPLNQIVNKYTIIKKYNVEILNEYIILSSKNSIDEKIFVNAYKHHPKFYLHFHGKYYQYIKD